MILCIFNAIYATRIHLHTVWIYCAKPLAVEAEPLHLFHLRALHLPAYMARACKIVSATLDAPARNTQPRYNVCPTTTIDAVVEEGRRELLPMRWGLVPSWWSKPLKEMKVATFNARAETVARKPVFRDAFKRTRCLIPASGYYEWHDTPGFAIASDSTINGVEAEPSRRG